MKYSLIQKIFLISIFLLFGVVIESSANNSQSFVLHPSWYQIKHKAENDPEFYGRPMSIKNIEHTGKKWKCGNKYCYTYRIIINRPGNDKGSGVIKFGDIPFKIQYWIGEAYSYESDVLASITGGYDISQLQTKPKELILSFNKPFIPGKYHLKIAPFPYPTSYGSSFEKYIGWYRADEASILFSVANMAKKGIDLGKDLASLGYGKLKDISIDTFMLKVANKYGIYLVLDIPAVMPDIYGIDVKRAHNRLLLASLKPKPKNWECKKTDNPNLVGMVFDAQYPPGKLLRANEQVVYEYYCPAIVMPKIKGMYISDANNVLRQLGLIPAPDTCKTTFNKKLDKKVFKHQYQPGEKLKPSQKVVAYKWYCYTANKPSYLGYWNVTLTMTSSNAAKKGYELKVGRKFKRNWRVSKVNNHVEFYQSQFGKFKAPYIMGSNNSFNTSFKRKNAYINEEINLKIQIKGNKLSGLLVVTGIYKNSKKWAYTREYAYLGTKR